VGTKVSYTDSEAGLATFTVQRPAAGRKVKGNCVAPSKKNRKAKKCTRYLSVGIFQRQSTIGANSFTFRGRVGGRKLKPGKYRLQIVAADAAGNRSAPRYVSFKIVKK
jgi:hypothetical protein